MNIHNDQSPEQHEQDAALAPEERRPLAFRPLDIAWEEEQESLWSDHGPHLDQYASAHFGHLAGLGDRG